MRLPFVILLGSGAGHEAFLLQSGADEFFCRMALNSFKSAFFCSCTPPALLVVPDPGQSVSLLVPEQYRFAPFFPAGIGRVISYGFSPKSDLTFSSIRERGCVLVIQRDLITVSGQLIERQELTVERPAHTEPTAALALFSTLLLLDFPPEKLGRDVLSRDGRE